MKPFDDHNNVPPRRASADRETARPARTMPPDVDSELERDDDSHLGQPLRRGRPAPDRDDDVPSRRSRQPAPDDEDDLLPRPPSPTPRPQPEDEQFSRPRGRRLPTEEDAVPPRHRVSDPDEREPQPRQHHVLAEPPEDDPVHPTRDNTVRGQTAARQSSPNNLPRGQRDIETGEPKQRPRGRQPTVKPAGPPPRTAHPTPTANAPALPTADATDGTDQAQTESSHEEKSSAGKELDAGKPAMPVQLQKIGNADPNRSLDADEEKLKAECESDIAENLHGFFVVGFCLSLIRDKKLYRNMYKQFEAYCRDRWDFSKAHVNRFILDYNCVKNLESAVGVKVAIPTKESHARCIANLAPDQQVLIAQKVFEKIGGKRATAKDFQAAREEIFPSPPKTKTKSSKPSVDGILDEGQAPAATAVPILFGSNLVPFAEWAKRLSDISNICDHSVRKQDCLRLIDRLKRELQDWADKQGKLMNASAGAKATPTSESAPDGKPELPSSPTPPSTYRGGQP